MYMYIIGIQVSALTRCPVINCLFDLYIQGMFGCLGCELGYLSSLNLASVLYTL